MDKNVLHETMAKSGNDDVWDSIERAVATEKKERKSGILFCGSPVELHDTYIVRVLRFHRFNFL